MPVDKVARLHSDGLHLLTRATLSHLAQDETVRSFAAGLLASALDRTNLTDGKWTLAAALHHSGPRINLLLTALLVLDAEVRAVVDDERRIFPLPGFLSYRAALPPDRFPLDTMRLPPLNDAGHYRLVTTKNNFFLAVRLDLHPTLKVAGHVRIAASSSTRSPTRLLAMEQRLDRQILTAALIEAAITAGCEEISPPLVQAEADGLDTTLRGLIE